MKFVTYRGKDGQRPGLMVGDSVYDLRNVAGAASPDSILQLLVAGMETIQHAAAHLRASDHEPVATARLCAPVPRPGKIVAVGRNYGAHARETGFTPRETPRIILKLASAVIGPKEVIRRPEGVQKLDWEVEIAVVMGDRIGGAKVTPAQAEDAIVGYTIANDITAREFQIDQDPPQSSFAKSMDGFAPMGPFLATRDEVGDVSTLTLRTWVNDGLMQEGCAGDMIFTIPDLIAYIARYITLEPGDVVLTGTPAGSGAFRDPPIYLQPGDRLRLEVDRLGVFENTVG